MLNMLILQLQKTYHDWSQREIWINRALIWSGAILIGIVSVIFAELSEWASNYNDNLYQSHPWSALLILPFGLLGIRYITLKYFEVTTGSGIPHSIAAMKLDDAKQKQRVLSPVNALMKLVLTFCGLLFGASIGREGPTVYIGSSILYNIGKFTTLNPKDINKGLIVAGGAAGISAAFNTPLAGIVFSIEELSKSFEERSSGLILSAVVLSGITAIAMIGDYAYFGFMSVTFPLGQTILYAIVIGFMGGALGGLFSSAILYFRQKLMRFSFQQAMIVTGISGLLIAIIGFITKGMTFGAGYSSTYQILMAQVDEIPFYYPILKMVATLLSYVSGIPGGIFTPAIAIGAGIGQVLSQITSELGPVFAVIGMCAFLTGVVQSPITAFVIVMELVDDHNMTMPLMVAAFIALGASRIFCHQPFYQTLANLFVETYSKRTLKHKSTDKRPSLDNT